MEQFSGNLAVASFRKPRPLIGDDRLGIGAHRLTDCRNPLITIVGQDPVDLMELHGLGGNGLLDEAQVALRLNE
jgi:hypothetical protein